MNYNQLNKHIVDCLTKIAKCDTSTLLSLTKRALQSNPLIIASITDFQIALQNSSMTPESYTMEIMGCYLFFNNFHELIYIGQSTRMSKRVTKHYSDTFKPDPESSFLTNVHAAEIKDQKMDIGKTIKHFPIFLFPMLIECNHEVFNQIEQLLKNIERRIINEWPKNYYFLYNNKQNLLNSPTNVFFVHSMTIQETKNYCMDRVSKLQCVIPPYERRLSIIKRQLFYGSKIKIPGFFDQDIFQNWLTKPQFWTDFSNKYSSKTVSETHLFFKNYVKENNTFSKSEIEDLKKKIITKVKTSVFCPIDTNATNIRKIFGLGALRASNEKRQEIQYFIGAWVNNPEFWETFGIKRNEYLESDIYKSFINTNVTNAKNYLLSKVNKKTIKKEDRFNLLQILPHYHSYANQVKLNLENWINSPEFLE